jgi:hypothetical protein
MAAACFAPPPPDVEAAAGPESDAPDAPSVSAVTTTAGVSQCRPDQAERPPP